MTSGESFQEVESFDAHFQIKVKTILTEYLALSLKKLSSEEYLKHVQKLVEEYLSFEKRGLNFKEFLTKGISTFQAETLTLEDLTGLYRFCCGRHTLPHQNPLQLLENSIFMCIQANKVSEALTRTETLTTFLLEKSPLSKHFISLRASVMALKGDCEEWRRIVEAKRNKAQKERAEVHQQQLNTMKAQQKKRKKEQEKIEKLKKTQQVITNEKAILNSNNTVDIADDSPVFAMPEPKPAIILPKEKVKTRNPARELTDQKQTLEGNTNGSCVPVGSVF